MRATHYAVFFAAALSAALSSCVSTGSKQLERVAKDWCLSIRASQVIPVYPLTEDVQPGDVFLVQVPIEEQVRVYEEKGFLPLENLVTRIPVTTYADFYARRYGIEKDSVPPGLWQFPKAQPSTRPATDWMRAPRSAFPSYSFSVSRDTGFNVAVPVHGVPIGLSLLGTSSANGSITIAKGYTYGVDMATLHRAVAKWGATEQDYLRQFAPRRIPPARQGGAETVALHYLRVVNRVYLTGELNVSLFGEEGVDAGATAGAVRPVDFSSAAETAKARENLDKVNELIGSGLAAAGPAAGVGGSVRVAISSGRSVSLIETFDRPLVIGYVGFDLQILEDGRLGSPVSTHAILAGEATPPGAPEPFGPDENTATIRAWLDEDPARREALRTWLREQGLAGDEIPNVLNAAEHAALRARIVREVLKR